MAKDLLRYFVRVADEQRATRAELGVEARAGGGRPAAFLGDTADGTGIAGKELIGGYLARGGDIAERVYADLERLSRDAARLAWALRTGAHVLPDYGVNEQGAGHTRVSIAQLKAVHQRTHPAHRTRTERDAQLSSLAAAADAATERAGA